MITLVVGQSWSLRFKTGQHITVGISTEYSVTVQT